MVETMYPVGILVETVYPIDTLLETVYPMDTLLETVYPVEEYRLTSSLRLSKIIVKFLSCPYNAFLIYGLFAT